MVFHWIPACAGMTMGVREWQWEYGDDERGAMYDVMYKPVPE